MGRRDERNCTLKNVGAAFVVRVDDNLKDDIRCPLAYELELVRAGC
jgi:hypothetical protein